MMQGELDIFCWRRKVGTYMSKTHSGVDIIALNGKVTYTTSAQYSIQIPKFLMFLLIGGADFLSFTQQSPY